MGFGRSLVVALAAATAFLSNGFPTGSTEVAGDAQAAATPGPGGRVRDSALETAPLDVDTGAGTWRAWAFNGQVPGPTLEAQVGDGLRVVGTRCPVAADVEKDARGCEACRSLQRHAACLAPVGQVQEVRFDRLMSESACEMRLTFRPDPKPRP